jgi:O-antigen/teichoic acid export membrane protein
MIRGRPTFGHALKWAMLMTSGTRAIGTLVTFVLAALLGPGDFGLVTVALVYVQFVNLLLEQGFLTAIIQREDLHDEHVDSAFWLNIGWCLLLGGLTYLSAGWWAEVNGMPRLDEVIKVLSVIVVIEGLGIVQTALMQRALDFKRLAIRSNLSAVLGGATGIPLALAGAGVWALVAQQVVLEATLVVMVWALSSWKPRFRFSVAHARELVGFSVNVFAANLAGFVNRRVDALVMGIFFGPAAVGLYRLGDRLVDVVLEVTTRPVGLVSLPILSRFQNDPAGLREATMKCLRATLLIAVPAFLVVVATSHELVSMLGSDWDRAAVPLELLSLAGIGKAIGYFTGPVLFAVSRPRFRAAMLWILAAVSTVTVLVVGQALRGASIGHQVVGMSISRAVLFLVVLIPVNLAIVRHFTGLNLRPLLRSVPAPVLSGLAAVAVVFAVRASGAVDGLPTFPALLVTGALATLTTTSLLITFDGTARGYARRLVRLARPSLEPRPAPGSLETAPPRGDR